METVRAWWRRRRTPERTVWCAGCGEELPVSKAVRVVDVPDDEDEAEMMGGTACMVEYHRRCAPPGSVARISVRTFLDGKKLAEYMHKGENP